MSTIITRSTGANPKGAPLTAGELDQNFINLNADKVEATRAVNTTAGDLTGGGDLSGDRTLGLASTGITAGTVNNSTTQLTPLTLDVKGRVTGVGTPQTIAPSFANVTGKPTTLSGYGITDAQATITGAATTIDTEDLTASRALASDSSGKVAVSSVTATELGYLSGVTSAVQTQLGGKQATSEKNQANGYAGLDSSGKLSDAVLPDLAISEYLGEVANETAMLALTGQEGDWCTRSDVGTIYIITGNPASTGGWMQLSYPGTPVKSVAGKTGVVTLVKGDVGLGNVDNTSDADKNSATVTLTNKTISGSSNTLSNIGNSSLVNSSITFGATAVSLGGTVSGFNGVSIGASSASTGAFTNLSYTGTLTGGTGVIAIGTNQIYKDASGNVGIGTSSPAATLDIRTSSSVVRIGNYNFAGINIFGSSVNTSGVYLGLDSGGGFATNVRDAGYLAYGTNNTERLRIDSSGNVGIGTSSPAAKLDVAATIRSTAQAVPTSGSGIELIGGASTNYLIAYNRTTPGFLPLVIQGNTVSLHGSNSTGLMVDASGNVGIGTGSPMARLTVSNGSNENFEFTAGTAGLNGGVLQYLNRSSSTTRPDMNYYLSAGLGAHKFYTSDLERARITAAGNWLVNDTVERGGKVVVTNTPTSQWGIDQSGSQITLTNGANAVLATGSGLIVLNSHTSGDAAVYLINGSQIYKLGGTASYVVSSTPSAGQVGVGWTGSSYAIYNNVGSTQTFGIAMIRTRAAV